MLSLGKLAPGQQQYYLDTVANGAEEYYTGAKESPGHWIGNATRRLAAPTTRASLGRDSECPATRPRAADVRPSWLFAVRAFALGHPARSLGEIVTHDSSAVLTGGIDRSREVGSEVVDRLKPACCLGVVRARRVDDAKRHRCRRGARRSPRLRVCVGPRCREAVASARAGSTNRTSPPGWLQSLPELERTPRAGQPRL